MWCAVRGPVLAWKDEGLAVQALSMCCAGVNIMLSP